MNQSTVSSEMIDYAIKQLFDTYDTNHDGKLSIS
jgi:Ca2+-binding EF-hand superfamily protein